MSTIKEESSTELKEGLATILNLQQQGQIDKAIEVSQQLLTRFRDHIPLIQNLGLLFIHINQPAQALELFKQAIKYEPRQALSYNLAGVVLCQMGALDEGIRHYKKALKYNSTLKEVQLNLGLALIEKNEFAKAEQYLHKAHEANLNSPILYYNLGLIEHQKKHLSKAIEYYTKALSIDSSYIKCAINLGEALFESSSIEHANKIFLQLAKILPDDKNIHKKLGATYLKLEQYDQAIHHLKIGFDPNEEDIFVYLSSAYDYKKDIKNEYETLILGLKHFPNNPTFLVTLLILSRNYCMWENHDELVHKLRLTLGNNDYLYRYPNYYILSFSLEEELLFARKIASYFTKKVAEIKKTCQFSFKRQVKNKLKIGYISANLKNHPNTHMISNIFNCHSRDGFEYYLYATDEPDHNNIFAKTLMTTSDHFVNLTGMTAGEAAHAIYKDDIDILVDLSAYHRALSSEILALHPAPLVLGFLGHCGTRGADYIDYIITDFNVTHLDEIKYYHEQLIFLPDTHYITNAEQAIAPIASRAAFKLPEDKFIFTCFNLNMKYEPKTFATWMKFLQKIPNSVLLLWGKDGESNLCRYAEEAGIDSQRLLFAEGVEKSVHLARLQVLDLFIDTFDCTAHCTAIDALLANLPIVTLYGKNVAQRGGSSILKAHGMDELIAYSVEEYEEKVLELATNRELLASVKMKIAANKQTYPLFNTKRFTSLLEQAFRKAHENYVAGNPPQHIFIE